ncbi:MAG: MutS2/Smr-associated SH3 domain-containing protein, partial [Bacteroidota bacterium]
MPEIDLVPADAETRLGFHLVRARLTASARTPYGRERLGALRPQSSTEAVRLGLERAGEMRAALASGAPVPVREAPDVRATLRRLGPQGAIASGEDLADVRRLLEALRTLHDDLHGRRATVPALWTVAQGIVVLAALEDRIARAIDDDGSVRDDASPELQRLSRQIASLEGQVRAAVQSALRAAAAEGYAAEDQPTIRGGRAVIPVRAEAKRKVRGFVQDVSGTGQTVYIEPAAAVDLNNEIREVQIARGREIERILADLSGHLRHHRPDVERSLGALAVLDEAHAAGRLAHELDALVPEIAEAGPMRLVQARNPALLLHLGAEAARIREETGRATEPRAVVPLDLTLGEDAHTLVVTGPNAGGKSVALKTVGLMALMAACGLPVPAAPGTRIVLPTRLFVDVGDRQSIEDDLSTFTSHLVLMRRVLEEADDRSLVLMDEAGTGTDPAEGGAIARAVLRRLTQRRALTLATTHIGALKAFAHDTPGVENAAMEFSRERLEPTYRFQTGVPGSSYAFEIARRVGLDSPVIAEARETLGESAARLEDLLAEAEARTETAEQASREAAQRLAEAERIKADYEQRLERHRAERDAIKAAALADADQILKDANAAVERAVREIKEAEAEREATQRAREQLAEKKQEVRRRARSVSTRQKRRARQPRDVSRLGAEAGGPIGVGDQVRLDEAGAVGEVLELTGTEAIVALGALTSRVKLTRLTKVGGRTEQQVIVGGPAARDPLPVTQARTRVDLRGQRVEAALTEVERLVDEGLA